MQKNVELLQYFGNDFMVCDVARVSYGKEAKNYTEEQNKKLIKYLWEHQHTSPFRHPQIQFRITCPIYVERQLFTHQVGIAKNCLHGDTLIRFKNDSGGNADISIRELWHKWTFGRPHQQSLRDSLYTQKHIQKKKCRVLNEITQVFEIGHIKNVYKSGVKKLFKITLQNGQFIICTAQHKIYTKNGWLSIEQGLSSKDFVGCNGIKYIGNRIGPKLKVHWSKIVSIQYHGEDETYDIEMFGPNHNFIANNIIVHNSISGRYVDFSDSYTKISDGNWRGNPANIKQGSGLPIDDIHIQSQCSLIEDEVIELAKKAYNQLLKYGVCKEQARTILPLNLNTQFIWTNSLQAFGHLCSLRLKPNAQEETRNIVNKMLQLVKEIPGNPFQHSLSAFGY